MGRFFAVLVGLVVAFTGVLFLAWLLWLLWKRLDGETETPAIEIKGEDAAPVPEPPVAEAKMEVEAPSLGGELPQVQFEDRSPEIELPEVEAKVPDDLKRIEGIGPKIAGVLQAAGVTTFAHLAEISADQIRQILEEADPRLLRLADPTTWPKQAELAAAGDLEALEAFQGELKGGRLV